MLARLAIVHLCVFKAFEGIAADSAVNTIFDAMRYNSYTDFSGGSLTTCLPGEEGENESSGI